jgi:hypothetical protein
VDTPPTPFAAGGETLKSASFDTVLLSALLGGAVLLFVSVMLIIAVTIGRDLRGASDDPVVILAIGLFIVLYPCTFLTAYVLSSFVFRVNLETDTITYRNGFGRYKVQATKIDEIVILDSLKSWQYIVIRSAGSLYVIPNLIWSAKGFNRLRERIAAWRGAGAFSFNITADDTFSNRSAHDVFFGSRKLPRQYRRYMPFCAGGYATLSVAVLVAAYLV